MVKEYSWKILKVVHTELILYMIITSCKLKLIATHTDSLVILVISTIFHRKTTIKNRTP